MSSWDDLFVIYNEAKKSDNKKSKKDNSDDLTLGDIENELDPNGEKGVTDDPTVDDFGENEFDNDLPTDNPDTSENPMADPDEIDIDGLDDDEDLDDEMMGDLEDPDGFDAMEDEMQEMEPEDKEKKAYMFGLLVRTINVAEKLSDEFVPRDGVDKVKKELKQLDKLIELLTYYKKYKFDALTDFTELESIIKKSVKAVDKLSKRMVNSNKEDKSTKRRRKKN